MTVEDAAEWLAVHPETVRIWLRRGELRGVRLGGRKAGWRIMRHDVEEFLRQRGETPPAETSNAAS